ncbi:MAG: PorV/PorQ family protein, partial [candidate division WOR-3 bacterium]
MTIISVLTFILTSSEPIGTSVMPLLRIGQGARAAGLGEAYAALAGDAYALFWNPAGLGQVQDYHIVFSHHQWFSRTSDELINAVLPAHRKGIGISLLYSAESGIEHWNEQNLLVDTFRTWSAVLSAGYGAELFPGYSLGIGFKGFSQNLRTTWGYGASTDIGILSCPATKLKFGLVGRNIGKAWYGDLADLPTEAVLGFAWCDRRLVTTLDLVYPLDNKLNLRAGFEFLPAPMLAVRMGYRTGPSDISSLGWIAGFTGGVGITLGNLGVDYAITPYGRLGTVHRLTLRTTVPKQGKGAVRIRTLDASTMQPLRADVTLSGIVNLSSPVERTGEILITKLRPGQLIIR